MPPRKAATPEGPIPLNPIPLETVRLRVVGDSELIMHQWSEKARRMMEERQQSRGPRATREPRIPAEDYEATIYRDAEGRPAMPAVAFKAAIVGACRLFEGLPMTLAKVALRVNGELVPIEGEPRMRTDMVRNETGVADLRYRAGFPAWGCVLSITYNARVLGEDQLIALVNAAGFGGVGDWRPSAPKSATGSYGTFHVEGVEPA